MGQKEHESLTLSVSTVHRILLVKKLEAESSVMTFSLTIDRSTVHAIVHNRSL